MKVDLVLYRYDYGKQDKGDDTTGTQESGFFGFLDGCPSHLIDLKMISRRKAKEECEVQVRTQSTDIKSRPLKFS